MIYVFIFLGEFGFELFNWQGVIRKFSATLPESDRIICCSRANLYPLYEMADEFVDISSVKLFQRSKAVAYYAHLIPAGGPPESGPNALYDRLLRARLKRYILKHSQILSQLDHKTSPREALSSVDTIQSPSGACTFIFSSRAVELNGCTFGRGSVYESLDVDNNAYRKIEPDLSLRPKIEERLGWSLSQPCILCQARRREVRSALSQDTVAKEALIKAIAQKMRLVLLAFNTGRWLDSYSQFDDLPNCFHFDCRSFPEQACLIHFANHCLFFTEGDFGSHIYVPPFLGRNVTAIAPWTVYQIGSTPIRSWNKQVFKFGGQVIPMVSEDVVSSDDKISAGVAEIISRTRN